MLKVTFRNDCFRRDDVEALLCCPGRAGVIVVKHIDGLVARLKPQRCVCTFGVDCHVFAFVVPCGLSGVDKAVEATTTPEQTPSVLL